MNFIPAALYRVRTKAQRKSVLRFYKWPELRFGSIPCHVFTAKVMPGTQATWDTATEQLTITGPSVPRSELSIPEYDLAEATLMQPANPPRSADDSQLADLH